MTVACLRCANHEDVQTTVTLTPAAAAAVILFADATSSKPALSIPIESLFVKDEQGGAILEYQAYYEAMPESVNKKINDALYLEIKN